jgi:hypothetical protein
MKLRWLAVVILSATAFAQSDAFWKPCKNLADKFKSEGEKFNADHKDSDGLQIEISCTYAGDPHYKRKPDQHIPLTAQEIEHLHELRHEQDAAFKSMDEYEKYLYKAHDAPYKDTSEPCWSFVGIVVNTDYITVDPNPGFPFEDCAGKTVKPALPQ